MKYLDVPQSGSQANTVASRNRFGQYLRTRAIPTNPNSIGQSLARTTMATLASLWGNIKPSERLAWEDCARRFPKTDSLGQTIVLSGFQQFIRSNSALTFVGASGTGLVPLPDTPFSATNIQPTVSTVATKTFDINYVVPPVGQFIVIDTSGQLSAGIAFCSDYRNLAIQSHGSIAPAEELAKYENKYGPLLVGKKIFFRSRCLNECGVYSAPFYTSTIVEGPVVLAARGAKAKASQAKEEK